LSKEESQWKGRS
jgi:chromosome segregation ATPase